MEGRKVNPQEIEDALVATGFVVEAAVVGVEDSLAGTRLAALVTPTERSTPEQEILRACLIHLPHYKPPSEWRWYQRSQRQRTAKSTAPYA